MLALTVTRLPGIVIVVGGGAVGQRKARIIHEAGFRVRIIALEVRPESAHLPEAIEWQQCTYEAAHLVEASLVIAAGPVELNQRVVGDALDRGLWVNCAAPPEIGNWLMPATIRRGELLLAIQTGGQAPSLARRIREKLEREFDDVFADWLQLLGEARIIVQERIADPRNRKELLERLSEWCWLERLQREGSESVREAIQQAIQTVVDNAPSSV